MTVPVGKHLHLDVTRPRQILFDQHAVVAETARGFAFARRKRRREILTALDHAHALSAATRARLEQHGITDCVGLTPQQLWILIVAVIAGHERHGSRMHQCFRGRFRTHRGNCFDRRPDEHDTRFFAGMREVLVFRQKTIAGVHRLCTRGARGFDDPFDTQIAFRRRRAAD